MATDLSCEVCHFPLNLVQDEHFGRLFVCPSGHWWIQNFKTFRMDRIYEEKRHAA